MKKLKMSDYVIIGLIFIGLIIGGFIMLKHKKISGLPETVDKKVYFQVMIRGVSITDTELPFKNGDEAFISIRNVPYTKLKINAVSFDRRKQVISANNQNGFLVVEDVSVPFLYDFIVTLEDNGKWTSDGYVLGGNKLKLGIPITLEGAKYKFNGTVSNIKNAEEVLQMEIPEEQQAKQ